MANRRGERQANPGAELRTIRKQLGWSLREVHAASVAHAKKCRQPAFVIPPSRLHDIESKNKIPSIHRLYALARIYGRTLNEILTLYGIPLRKKWIATSKGPKVTSFMERRGPQRFSRRKGAALCHLTSFMEPLTR
jgi:transcriptional regulator with XRE-family HTH domain